MNGPTIYRHKNGSEYTLVGYGRMQTDNWRDPAAPADNCPQGTHVNIREVAIYHSAADPDELWVMPREEFEDGRFKARKQEMEWVGGDVGQYRPVERAP